MEVAEEEREREKEAGKMASRPSRSMQSLPYCTHVLVHFLVCDVCPLFQSLVIVVLTWFIYCFRILCNKMSRRKIASSH